MTVHAKIADEQKTHKQLLNELKSLRAKVTDSDRLLAELTRTYKSAPIGVCVFDLNLRFVHINHWLAEINGLPIEEHLGRTVREVLPNFAVGIEQQLRQVIETEIPILGGTVESETPAQPGFRKTFRHNYYPIKSGDAAVVGVTCVVEDMTAQKQSEAALLKAHAGLEIRVGERTSELTALNSKLVQEITERNRAESELRESEERFRDITANVPGIVFQFRLDAAGEPSFPYVSPAIKEILGIEAADTVADPDTWFDIIHPDDRPGLDASIEETHRTLQPWLWEGRNILASGEVGWFRGSSTPRKQDDGSVLWTGIVLDITESKRVRKALQESEARYREIFDESPAAIWEDDWSSIKQMLDKLARDGVKDWRSYFVNHRDQLRTAYNLAKITNISRAAIDLYRAESKEELARITSAEIVIDEELDAFRETVLSFLVGQMSVDIEAKDSAGDGSEIIVRRRVVMPPKYRDDWSRVIFAMEDTTQRNRAEQELRESEELVRSILDHSPAAIYLKDTEGRFLLVNKRFEEWYGYSPSASIGKSTHDLFPKHLADGYMALDREVILSGQAQESEFEAPFSDGSMRAILATKFPVRGPDGSIIGIGTINTDITERQRVEGALRASEARLMDSIESISEGFVIYDADERFVLCNSKYRDFYSSVADILKPGIKLEELAREVLLSGNAIGECDTIEESLKRRLINFRTIEGTHVQRLEDGHWLLCSERRTRTGDTVGIRTDITESKRAEEALRESEARLNSFINNIPNAIYLKDTEGHYVLVNDSATKQYQLPDNQLIGKTVYDLHPKSEADATAKQDREVMKHGVPIEAERELTFPDNSKHTIIAVKFPVRGESGENVGVGGINIDITERKRAEEALQEREARLRELQAQLNHVSRLSEMGQISSQIAHELNQPLTAILNYVQAAGRLLEQGRPEDAERVREVMALAADQTESAGAIIRNLRQFVERGETVSTKADINKILEEANALALVGTGDGDIVTRMELGSSLPAVFVDRLQIQQVVVNLVRNAVDAMAASPRRKLTITSDLNKDGHVTVAVADTGTGLSEEVAESLFQPFVTTKADGIGIGLSLSLTIIKAHGGRLWVEPNPGGGTVFSFTLPPEHDGGVDRIA